MSNRLASTSTWRACVAQYSSDSRKCEVGISVAVNLVNITVMKRLYEHSVSLESHEWLAVGSAWLMVSHDIPVATSLNLQSAGRLNTQEQSDFYTNVLLYSYLLAGVADLSACGRHCRFSKRSCAHQDEAHPSVVLVGRSSGNAITLALQP
jgi:hypothetical protein